MKNKGFSLVELIIVIAIMAILAAAIAPALIRYIDKSRRADDVAAAETINTAAQAAFSNEDAYDAIQSNIPGTFLSATNGQAFAGPAAYKKFQDEVNSSVGGTSPALKYKKNGANTWYVGANDAGKPVVWLKLDGTGGNGSYKELQPTIDGSYK